MKEKSGGEIDGKPFYSVAQRGALDITTLSGPFYSGLYSYGGRDFNDDLTPAMNNEYFDRFPGTVHGHDQGDWFT